MTIELAIVISTISLLFTAINVITSVRARYQNQDKTDATQLTTIIVKLERIGTDISEIKSDSIRLNDDIRSNTERIIRLEQEVKVLNKEVFNREIKN